MLVLSRKVFESITIVVPGGLEAKVVVQKVAGNRVALALEGPDDVRFVRTELLEQPHDMGSPIA